MFGPLRERIAGAVVRLEGLLVGSGVFLGLAGGFSLDLCCGGGVVGCGVCGLTGTC